MLLGKVDEDEEFLTVDRFQVTGSHLSRDYVAGTQTGDWVRIKMNEKRIESE